MNAADLQDAFGEIQDCYLAEAHSAPVLQPSRSRKWIAALLIAALIAMGLVACAPILFNSIAGDTLSFQSAYLGNGIVEITVENRSDKRLKFQPVLKLVRCSTGEEIPAQGKVLFSGTDIPAESSGIMTLDLSGAYDMADLEASPSGDRYDLVLTNNRFAFGQDWMCTIRFSEEAQETEPVYPVPLSPAEADPTLVQRVEPELQDLFQKAIFTDKQLREEVLTAYYARCAELLAASQRKVIRPVFPMPAFLMGDISAGTILDPNVPEDAQYQLISETASTLDSYAFPVGADWEDSACILSVIIPQTETDLYEAAGASLPLLYLMVYSSEETQQENTCTIIRGQLVSLSDLKSSTVYQDPQYTVFNVTDYFYSDLDTHMNAFRRWRTDLLFNKDVDTRIRNTYAYLQKAITEIHLSN